MKPLNPIFYLLSSLFLVGCSLHELSVDHDAKQLAPTLGVKATDIKFVSYCDWGTAGIGQDGFRAQKGIIAVTDGEFHFMTRHKEYLFSKEASTLPSDRVQGVSLKDDQIQLKGYEMVLILQLDDASTRTETQEKYEDLFQAILAMGVPAYDSPQSYTKLGYVRTRRPSSRSGQDGYGGHVDTPRLSTPNRLTPWAVD